MMSAFWFFLWVVGALCLGAGGYMLGVASAMRDQIVLAAFLIVGGLALFMWAGSHLLDSERRK